MPQQTTNDDPKSILWVASSKDEVSTDHFKFVAQSQATEWLKARQTKVNLVTIFGKARSGKSTFLNFLNGDEGGAFETDGGLVSFTQGSHLSTNLQQLEKFGGKQLEVSAPSMNIGLIDNEGSGQKSEVYDTMLLLPSMVISQAIIYMIAEDPQPHTILKELATLVNIRNRMELGGAGKLGHLHVLCRLRRKIRGGGTLEDFIMKDEVEKEGDPSITERNKWREDLKTAFTSIIIWDTYDKQMIGSEEHLDTGLHLSDFDESYHEFFEKFTKTVADQCASPRELEGMPADPDTAYFAHIMKHIVDALNTDNDAKFPVSFFDQVQVGLVNELCDKLMDEKLGEESFIAESKSKWKETTLPTSAEDVIAMLKRETAEVVDTFKEETDKKYKEKFVDACVRRIHARGNLLKPSLVAAYKELAATKLSDDLVKYLDDNGCDFLKQACAENKITSKVQFMTVRDSPGTKEVIFKGLTDTQKITATKAIYQSADFDKRTSDLKKRSEYFNSLIDDAKKTEAELRKLNKEKLDKTDAKLKEGIDSMRSKLADKLKINLPTLGDSRQDLLEAMLSLQKDVGGYTDKLCNMKEIPDSELVAHFQLNNGLLLRQDGVIDTCDSLFTYENARVSSTNKPSDVDRTYFESSAASQTNMNTITTAGRSLGIQATVGGAGFVGGGVGAFSVSCGLAIASQEESAIQSAKGSVSTELHSIQSEYIPMGELSMNRDEIKLHPQVQKKLKQIAKIPDRNERRKFIWSFMEQYGSHICLKVILGGHYMEKSKAVYESGETKENMELIMATSFDANFGASGSYLGEAGLVKGGIDIDGKKVDFTGSAKSGTVTFDNKTISFSRSVLGGDKVAAKELWKQSLVYNANYAIIDRIAKDIVGLWHLLPEDVTKTSPSSLQEEFKIVWMNEALRPKQPYINSMEELEKDLQNTFLLKNKSSLVERSCPQKEDLTTEESDLLHKYVGAMLLPQLKATGWNVENAVKRCKGSAEQALKEHRRNRDDQKLAYFLKVTVKLDADFDGNNMKSFELSKEWVQVSNEFRNRKWPKHVIVDLQAKWGLWSFSSSGKIKYSNNKLSNSGSPDEAWAEIECWAKKKDLREADFTDKQINGALTEPMFTGKITSV